jgi:hypothetical protein
MPNGKKKFHGDVGDIALAMEQHMTDQLVPYREVT